MKTSTLSGEPDLTTSKQTWEASTFLRVPLCPLWLKASAWESKHPLATPANLEARTRRHPILVGQIGRADTGFRESTLVDGTFVPLSSVGNNVSWALAVCRRGQYGTRRCSRCADRCRGNHPG